MKSKSPKESEVIMTEIVLPQHTNALDTIFGGVVMSWIDIAAAIAATRHSGMVCVTASIDELHFLKPIKKGHICNISARITSVNKSSCEVRVLVGSENPLDSNQAHTHTATAFLTFVALDKNGKPCPMPSLKIESPEDAKLNDKAHIRRESRTKLREKLTSY